MNPFHEGYLAGFDSLPFGSATGVTRLAEPCPYPEGSSARRVWFEGYVEWMRDIRRSRQNLMRG